MFYAFLMFLIVIRDEIKRSLECHFVAQLNLQAKKDEILKYILKMRYKQGVWNRREIQMTRPALQYDYTCFADGTTFE